MDSVKGENQLNEDGGITVRFSNVEILGALDLSSFCRVGVGVGQPVSNEIKRMGGVIWRQ